MWEGEGERDGGREGEGGRGRERWREGGRGREGEIDKKNRQIKKVLLWFSLCK